jgi:hypothetical protein
MFFFFSKVSYRMRDFNHVVIHSFCSFDFACPRRCICWCQVPFFVSLALDIAPQHHPVVVGQSGANIRQVMQRSGATIQFPGSDMQLQHQQRGTIYITGTMASVCLARQLLLVRCGTESRVLFVVSILPDVVCSMFRCRNFVFFIVA